MGGTWSLFSGALWLLLGEIGCGPDKLLFLNFLLIDFA